MALCTLADVKAMLNISTDDTNFDDKLELMIKQVSYMIESYIGYKLEMATYSEEIHSSTFFQLLKLNHYPIQSITSVTINGEELTDYTLDEVDANNGFVFRGCAWNGGFYTRGMTHDIVSGAFTIKVTYTAGYYLPDDTKYVEGNSDALPLDIQTACTMGVLEMWNKQGSLGIKSHSEGGITTTFADSEDCGLSKSVVSILAKYKEIGVA